MNITARADYAIEAVLTLAHATADEPDRTVTADAIAERADIPRKFLESILRDLRRAGIVSSTRGSRGGYVLALPPEIGSDFGAGLEGIIDRHWPVWLADTMVRGRHEPGRRFAVPRGWHGPGRRFAVPRGRRVSNSYQV